MKRYSHSHRIHPTVRRYAALAWLGLAACLRAQLPDAFNPVTDGSVSAIAVQADGKVVIGGSFSSVGGEPRTNLARLLPDGTVDPAYHPNPDGAVRALLSGGSGSLYIGGDFHAVAGQGREHFAALAGDGSVDQFYKPGFNGSVYALAWDLNDILIGGAFTTAGGASHTNLARMSGLSGQIDTNFNPWANGWFSGGQPWGNTVKALAVQPDGRILVAGFFVELTGYGRYGIGRLEANGQTDMYFQSEADGDGYDVRALVLQPDGKVIVGGNFTNLNSQACMYLGRLNTNGTRDFTFQAPAVRFPVNALALQADGKLLVGRDYWPAYGSPTNLVTRLNPDGSLDGAFAATGFDTAGHQPSIAALALQADGSLLVGGTFDTAVTNARANLCRLVNPTLATQSLSYDGTNLIWSQAGAAPVMAGVQFRSATNFYNSDFVGTATAFAGGWQLSAPGLAANLSLRGEGFAAPGSGGSFYQSTVGPAQFLAQPADRQNNAGTVAEFYAPADGSAAVSYRWRKNGTNLNNAGNVTGAFGPLLTLSNVLAADAAAYSVVVQNLSQTTTSLVARLQVIDPVITRSPSNFWGNVGAATTLNCAQAGTPTLAYQWLKNGTNLPGANNAALALTNLQAGNAGRYQLVVTNALGVLTSAVAVVSVNAALCDASFRPQTGWPQPESMGSYSVQAVAVQSDGSVLAGGSLPRALNRLSAAGALDTNFYGNVSGWGNGSSLQAFAALPGGKFLVFGYFFTQLQGVFTNFQMARIDADGSLDTPLPGPSGQVDALALLPDGRILVGGGFSSFGDQSYTNLVRLNADGNLDPTFHPSPMGSDARVSALAPQPDGKVLVGGTFESLAGQPCTNLGRLQSDGNLDPTFAAAAFGDAYNVVTTIGLQADGRILVGGAFTNLAGMPCNNLGRLNAVGAFDALFAPGLDSTQSVGQVALQADGQAIASGSFGQVGNPQQDRLARFAPDGTRDPVFCPGLGLGVSGGGEANSLAIQPDGALLIGGYFSSAAGQNCTNLVRLAATAPASQTLAYDGTNLTWLRGGSGPEVYAAGFEASTNGSNWISVGSGRRVAGGWQMTNLTLAAPGFARARGLVVGSAAAWFVEQTLALPAITNVDSQPPTLTITLPTSTNLFTSPTCRAEGAAQDNVAVASVWYQLNGGAWSQATGTTNWSVASLTLKLGTNTLLAYCVDTSGNRSLTNRVSFLYAQPALVTVTTNGPGSISPNPARTVFTAGKKYTLTANPAANCIFAGWTGSLTSASRSLLFTLVTNLVLQANFITNPFPAVAGTYQGLFADTNVAVPSAGSWSASVTAGGGFSAKVLLAGKSYAFSGSFSPAGAGSNRVALSRSDSLLILSQLDLNGGDVLTANLSAGNWTASLVAYRSVFTKANPAPQKGQYTLLVPGSDDSTAQPGGEGYGALTVDALGNATLSGKVADGNVITRSAYLSKTARWPLYVSLYGGKGLLFGWLRFTNEPTADLSGMVTWLKLPQPTPKVYTNGFAIEAEALGSRYLYTNQARLLNFSTGQVWFASGNLPAAFTNQAVLAANNKLSSTNKNLSLTFTTASGLFKGTVNNPFSPRAKLSFEGAVFQKLTNADGFFLNTNQSGRVFLGP